jgi:hypothetical protein
MDPVTAVLLFERDIVTSPTLEAASEGELTRTQFPLLNYDYWLISIDVHCNYDSNR